MNDLDIMHVDMDAFFAAVEQIDNPELKGKPVIIGGTGLDNRGVVSTASYEAREYGVHSAMPLIKARRLCPDGIYLPGRRERYNEVSAQVFEIFSKFTPKIEKISIDEAFLDLKGCHRLFGNSREIGMQIKTLIKNEIGLVASVGIAPNKFLAKLASDLEKPDGFVVIEKEQITKVLVPLPVGKLWGVGEKTEQILSKRGINTVGKIKKLSKADLKSLFGKFGERLYFLARGIDNRTVNVEDETKSISHEQTFKNSLCSKDRVLSVLMNLCEKVTRRLRQSKLKGKTVFIKIRYDDFNTCTRRITLESFFDNTKLVYEKAKSLLEADNLLEKPVRLIGVGVSNLSEDYSQQLSLFSSQKTDDSLVETIDFIKDRFGEDSIRRAKGLISDN